MKRQTRILYIYSQRNIYVEHFLKPCDYNPKLANLNISSHFLQAFLKRNRKLEASWNSFCVPSLTVLSLHCLLIWSWCVFFLPQFTHYQQTIQSIFGNILHMFFCNVFSLKKKIIVKFIHTYKHSFNSLIFILE